MGRGPAVDLVLGLFVPGGVWFGWEEDMKDIKPVETLYAGVRFRSRLEARWAVFFTAAGIPWEYEPERYALSDGRWYIPDFRLDGRIFAEVKPPGGSFEKAQLFPGPILLLDGPPGSRPYNRYLCLHTEYGENGTDWAQIGVGDMDPHFFWGFGAEEAYLHQAPDAAISRALSERFGAY